MEESEWIICPVCHNKTRTKIRRDTLIKNIPQYSPKCKQETLIDTEKLNTLVIREPDA